MSLKRIEIKSGNYLEQIKFILKDDKEIIIGSNKGKTEKLKPIMTTNEYIVKISHETYKSNYSVGVGITFVTNKGRDFEFYTQSLSTKLDSEMVHMKAEEGFEIVYLKIRKGVLEDIETKKIENYSKYKGEENFIVYYYEKEKEKVEYSPYKTKGEAKKFINKEKLDNYILIDFQKSIILKDKSKTDRILEEAIEKGHYIENRYKKISKLNVLIEIFKEINTFKDLIPLIITNFFLTIANYFSLTSNIIMAKLLTLSEDKLKDNILLTYLDNWINREDYRETIIISLIFIVFFENIFKQGNSYILNKFKETRRIEIENKNLKHLLSLDQSFFDTNSLQEISSSMNVNTFTHIIGWSIPTTIHKIFHLIMIIYFMISISLEITLMTCFIMLFLKYTLLEFLRNRSEIFNKIYSKSKNLTQQIKNIPCDIITTVKLFGAEKYHIKEYEKIENNSLENMEKSNMAEIQFITTYQMLEVCCFSSIVYTGMKFVNMDIISPEKLTSFFLIFKDFQIIIGHINWHLRTLTKEFPELEKFNWFLGSKSNMKNGKKIYNFNNDIIELRNVSFTYPSRPEIAIINNLNLKFKKNKTTALVGESGSGKSTVSKLITRLYDPQEGKIILGNVDLKDYDIKSVLKKFAIVTQKPEFFASTIRDNLTYALDRDISEEEIISACKKAECYDFICDLPYKLETIIDGDNLSGGQNQRISIARAILRNPDFLILDEATSALDTENEFKITETLRILMKNKTVIIIAHRLSTIKNVDEIICLKNGKIIERGNHENLLIESGYYKNLVQNQL